MERSVILVKPDALQRGLVGQIISRFEQKGLKLLAIKMIALSDEILDEITRFTRFSYLRFTIK